MIARPRILSQTSAMTVFAALLCVSWQASAQAPAEAPKEGEPSRATTQRSRPDRPSGEVASTEFRVFPLKHTSASEAAIVLGQLLRSGPGGGRGFGGGFMPGAEETIIADSRTNSLIVRAVPAVLEQVASLIETLDQPQPTQVRVFTLQHIATAGTQETLARMLGDRVRIAVDEVGNRVIAHGNAEQLDVVEALLMKLDESPAEQAEAPPAAAPQDFQVRVVWLVAGLNQPEAAAPPPDLENVVKELEKMGVTGLETGAQVFVKTIEGEQFSVRGMAAIDGPCNLQVSGTCRRPTAKSVHPALKPPRSAPPQKQPLLLQISIQARTEQGDDLANLETTITAPEEHSVVLGVSPVGSLTSVFVVQIRR